MRHKLSKLYLDNGKLVWNGNAVDGNNNIQKFYEDLPPSVHIINCLDSQPIRGKIFLHLHSKNLFNNL